ncbi:splicing factor [Theileria orientalis]|uniref:Pre-mRNA-splicing factor SLU7 n=1 Tax=Theileria orientalis TaxID=68886 RepID=A0A976QSP1_THEOR|nr:splicing factor [Theileria orientalis]
MSSIKSKTRDELKRERELDEARKAGTAPALKDELGNEINPHIPQYISKAPWYLDQGEPSLRHQRTNEVQKAPIDFVTRRGVTNKVAVKFRKGACENCGAMTHDAKACVERPRKKGAKFTNENICPDEFILENSEKSYDATRDRWAGFDPSTHLQLVEEYKDLEHERALNKIVNITNEDEFVEDDDKHIEKNETFECKDDKTRTTTRNLRIREDTAKYLINLDVNSAFYDPKSRSMREDPLAGANSYFKGDNYYFNSEETYKPKELEVFAWESKKKGVDVDFIANPTKLEKLYNETKQSEEKEVLERKQKLIERFKAKEYIENYKELKPLAKVSEEDIIKYDEKQLEFDEGKLLGHSQVWGSYYDLEKGVWGYKCCKVTNRSEHCKL